MLKLYSFNTNVRISYKITYDSIHIFICIMYTYVYTFIYYILAHSNFTIYNVQYYCKHWKVFFYRYRSLSLCKYVLLYLPVRKTTNFPSDLFYSNKLTFTQVDHLNLRWKDRFLFYFIQTNMSSSLQRSVRVYVLILWFQTNLHDKYYYTIIVFLKNN